MAQLRTSFQAPGKSVAATMTTTTMATAARLRAVGKGRSPAWLQSWARGGPAAGLWFQGETKRRL